jgi:hypothetical protein
VDATVVAACALAGADVVLADDVSELFELARGSPGITVHGLRAP